jgi:hypothetical protein
MTSSQTSKREIDAREYLTACFEPTDRLAILMRNRRRAETVQRITTAAKIEEPSFQEGLHFKNERDGFDIYVGMNPLKAEARTRTKDDILSIRHLYVDLDHDGSTSLAAIQQSNVVPPPNYVLSTSPGKFQAIWSVEDLEQEQAEALLRLMARKFGGDPVATDSTRVLRIPGFANRKYDHEFIVRAEQHSDRIHHFLDFKLRIDHGDSPYHPVRRALSRATSTQSLSQSEHDWAFAKRALARGADPRELIRQIAEFRRGDKHDREYYATYTVEKALAQFSGSKSPSSETEHDADRETPLLED